MITKHLQLIVLLSMLFPIVSIADVWQDPVTKVNYEYTSGQKVASVKAGDRNAFGSPDVTGNIAILSSFTVGGNEYTVTSVSRGRFRDHF